MYFKEPRREGIRLRFEKDVCPEIREECIQFVQWLRKRISISHACSNLCEER